MHQAAASVALAPTYKTIDRRDTGYTVAHTRHFKPLSGLTKITPRFSTAGGSAPLLVKYSSSVFLTGGGSGEASDWRFHREPDCQCPLFLFFFFLFFVE